MKKLMIPALVIAGAFALASSACAATVYTTSATSGKFSEIAWSPSTPTGGADVELVFTGANFNLENDIDDFAFSKLNLSAKGTIRGKRLKATAPASGHDAILYFGAQGAAITAPLYLADNLTVTNNLNPTISGYTKINGVDGDISGPGRLTFWCAHRLSAQGYVSLFGRNTFSGGLDIQLGNVMPTNVVALGTGKVYCTNVTASVKEAANYARLWLKNFAGVEYTQTLTNEVFVGPQLANVSNTARFQTDGNFTFTDAAVLHAVGNYAKINGYGKWTLKKGIDAIDSTVAVWETGGNDNNISEMPLNMPTTKLLAGHQSASNKGAIRFKVAGNRVGSLSAYQNAVFAFDVDNAFSVAPDLEPMNNQAGMIVELNGTTQTFGSHVDGSSHAPLLIRNSNTDKSVTVTLKQNTANRNSSLTTSGPMTFVKDGSSTLTTAKGFWVDGDIVVRSGMLQLYGSVSNHLAKTVAVEGGELDLGGGLFTCGKLQLKGGRISNGTLVCTDCAEIESGESTAEIVGTIVKKGSGAASVYTARRAARGGDGLPSGTVFYMAFDDPDNIGKVTVGGADLQAEYEKIPSYQAAGVFGGCAYFDGDKTALSSLKVGYPTGLPNGAEPYTVSAWICVSNGCDAAGGWIAYGKAGAAGQGNNFRLTNTSNDIWNYWYSMDVGCPADGIRDGQWHHVVGTFDGTTRKIYYDGALGISDSTMTPNIGTTLLLVGRTLNAGYLKGCIDEVLILNRAATDAEVRGLFLRGAESVRGAVSVADGTVKTSTLTAKGASLYYPLSSEADLLKDFSGNGKNLTKGGTGTVSFSTDSPFGTGGSASFDGASYLRHNSFPESFPTGAASYTVCMFVKTADSSLNNGCFVGYGENAQYHANHFRLNSATAQLCNYWASEGFNMNFKDGGTFKDGHWHSVVGTYDSATGKRVNYIDGGQTVGTQQLSYKPIIVAKNFTIGCDSYRQTEWFTGKIAEVAVFPRVLTAAEVAQYHAAGLSGGGLRVAGTYQPGGTVDGNLVLADGVIVVGGARQVVTGDVLVEGAGEYVPPSVDEAFWDFIDFGGELLGDSAENLKEWTVQGLATGYVKGRKNKLRAYAYAPGLLLFLR